MREPMDVVHQPPLIDPSENVKALSEAANKRQDDLREAAERFMLAEIKHATDMAEVRESHQHELRVAEAARLNAIRQVDREEVAKTAAQAQAAIRDLAAVTTTTAETLRFQQARISDEQNKRLSALELALSKGEGKSAGVNWVWAVIVGAVSFFGGVIAIAVTLWGVFGR